MSGAALLAAAMVLDAALGEPDWAWRRWPHPAVLMGRAIGWADARFNRGRARRARGAAVLAALIGAMGALGALIAALPGGWLIETLLAAILIAQRSLVDHVRNVAIALGRGPQTARDAVARIVGRDTARMDRPAVARAAIESAAENLSDGVTAPVMAFALAGLPGILIYKMINTADSMIGYRTPRHAHFGWAAARVDDVVNWVPARVTALLLAGLTGHLRQWRAIAADARRHRSPNAGWPEAAMARALGVALSGPRSYEGRMLDFTFVHPDGNRAPGAPDILRACRHLWRVWAALLICVLALALWP